MAESLDAPLLGSGSIPAYISPMPRYALDPGRRRFFPEPDELFSVVNLCKCCWLVVALVVATFLVFVALNVFLMPITSAVTGGVALVGGGSLTVLLIILCIVVLIIIIILVIIFIYVMQYLSPILVNLGGILMGVLTHVGSVVITFVVHFGGIILAFLINAGGAASTALASSGGVVAGFLSRLVMLAGSVGVFLASTVANGLVHINGALHTCGAILLCPCEFAVSVLTIVATVIIIVMKVKNVF